MESWVSVYICHRNRNKLEIMKMNYNNFTSISVLNGIVEIFLNGVDLIFGSDNIISMFVRNSGFCLQFSTYGILANIEIGVISCGTDQVAYLLKLAQNVLTNVGNLIDLILTVIQQLLGKLERFIPIM